MSFFYGNIMKRPSEKFLKDMSAAELTAEAEWHARRADELLAEVDEMREAALDYSDEAAAEALRSAMEKETEADAHIRQSHLLDSLRATRLSDLGVGDVVHAAKA